MAAATIDAMHLNDQVYQVRNDLMVNAMTGPPPATALQLLLTAERLFAEHGLAGISLRQISLRRARRTIRRSNTTSAPKMIFSARYSPTAWAT